MGGVPCHGRLLGSPLGGHFRRSANQRHPAARADHQRLVVQSRVARRPGPGEDPRALRETDPNLGAHRLRVRPGQRGHHRPLRLRGGRHPARRAARLPAHHPAAGHREPQQHDRGAHRAVPAGRRDPALLRRGAQSSGRGRVQEAQRTGRRQPWLEERAAGSRRGPGPGPHRGPGLPHRPGRRRQGSAPAHAPNARRRRAALRGQHQHRSAHQADRQLAAEGCRAMGSAHRQDPGLPVQGRPQRVLCDGGPPALRQHSAVPLQGRRQTRRAGSDRRERQVGGRRRRDDHQAPGPQRADARLRGRHRRGGDPQEHLHPARGPLDLREARPGPQPVGPGGAVQRYADHQGLPRRQRL